LPNKLNNTTKKKKKKKYIVNRGQKPPKLRLVLL
jgi:hypothetical protein